jgi:hypothetical protein
VSLIAFSLVFLSFRIDSEDVKPRGGDLGRLYVLKQFFNTSVVTVPVLNARLDFWTKYESYLANGTNIQVTVTDGPDENPWIALRASWWWPFWITISIVWALTNSALCIFLISRLTRERSLALVVLSLELASNLSTHETNLGDYFFTIFNFLFLQCDFHSFWTRLEAGGFQFLSLTYSTACIGLYISQVV